jgi:hypothetical protein
MYILLLLDQNTFACCILFLFCYLCLVLFVILKATCLLHLLSGTYQFYNSGTLTRMSITHIWRVSSLQFGNFFCRCTYTQHLDKILEEAATAFYPHIKFVWLCCYWFYVHKKCSTLLMLISIAYSHMVILFFLRCSQVSIRRHWHCSISV